MVKSQYDSMVILLSSIFYLLSLIIKRFTVFFLQNLTYSNYRIQDKQSVCALNDYLALEKVYM